MNTKKPLTAEEHSVIKQTNNSEKLPTDPRYQIIFLRDYMAGFIPQNINIVIAKFLGEVLSLVSSIAVDTIACILGE